jgi:hypothetical protein
MMVKGKTQNVIYSLIPLGDFKALLGVDDKEDKTSRFCLITATFTIEQFCKRRFLRKTHVDYISYTGDHILTLREYPLRKILSVSLRNEKLGMSNGEIVNSLFYYSIPDVGVCEDIPFSLVLRPPLSKSSNKAMFKVRYSAGYSIGKVPPDLASACFELAAWNMARYRGQRIGMTGNVRGSGRDGEYFEMSMPENVRSLLEPYRRKVI